VHAENLLIDDCGDWQAVEAIGKGLPKLNIVTTFAFVVEPINSVDGGAFVVAAQNEEVLGIFDLVSEQQADGFRATACRGPHSRPGTGSWRPVGSRRTRTDAADRNIGRECRRKS